MEFWRAEKDMTPLAGQIYEAWHGMRGRLADMRVNTEYQGAVQLLSEFAQLNLSKYGIEQLGVITHGLRDAEFADRITKGPNAPFTKEQISPNWLLWWGVQLSGTPVIEYSDRGKMHDGPAKVLPDLPTRELRDRFGTNLSALQVMSIVCMAAKKMPDSRWARDMGIAIGAATHKFAAEQGMERRMKQLTAEIPSVSKKELGDMFERLKNNRERVSDKASENPLADRLDQQVKKLTRAQQVAGTAAKDISSLVKQGTTGLFADEEGGPSVTFNDLVRGASPHELQEAFALIGNKLGVAPAAAPALPAPVVTPEAALVAVVAGDKVADKDAVADKPAAKKVAAKKPAAKTAPAKKPAAMTAKRAPAAK